MKRTRTLGLCHAALVAAALGTLLAAAPAAARLQVLACEPEWASLAQEIGGDQVAVYTATTAMQNPHYVEARPSLIARARNADITVCTGAELEVGWMPMVTRQAANPRILPGGPGAFEAARHISLLEAPARLDRSEGDIHAEGNPHVQTDPRNILAVAGPLADTMAALDPANAAHYRSRQADFARRFADAIARWQAAAAQLHGVPVAVQHRSWVYLFQWLGLHEVVALEPKPGVPPSSGHLAQVVTTVERQPVRFVIRAAHENDRPARFLAERLNIPIVVLPFTVGGSPRASDLFALYDDTIDRLLAGLRRE